MSKPIICSNKQYMCELDWYHFRGDINDRARGALSGYGAPSNPNPITTSTPPPHQHPQHPNMTPPTPNSCVLTNLIGLN